MHEKIDKLFNSHLRYIRHSHNEVNRYFAHGEHANSSVLDLIEDLINEKAHPGQPSTSASSATLADVFTYKSQCAFGDFP